MKARLRSFSQPLPQSPWWTEFESRDRIIQLRAGIGTDQDDEAEDDFYFTFCTVGALATEPLPWNQRPDGGAHAVLRGYIILESLTIANARAAVSALCDDIEGTTWTEISDQLMRVASGYEFEARSLDGLLLLYRWDYLPGKTVAFVEVSPSECMLGFNDACARITMPAGNVALVATYEGAPLEGDSLVGKTIVAVFPTIVAQGVKIESSVRIVVDVGSELLIMFIYPRATLALP
ncbi:MAG: Immunity protein 8 [Cyanobacteria bacterium RYN_339]|nr:Immunity protein 8 [Cyanobacteria bacterium RYN_339]